jgi:hypothetical protein
MGPSNSLRAEREVQTTSHAPPRGELSQGEHRGSSKSQLRFMPHLPVRPAVVARPGLARPTADAPGPVADGSLKSTGLDRRLLRLSIPTSHAPPLISSGSPKLGFLPRMPHLQFEPDGP